MVDALGNFILYLNSTTRPRIVRYRMSFIFLPFFRSLFEAHHMDMCEFSGNQKALSAVRRLLYLCWRLFFIKILQKRKLFPLNSSYYFVFTSSHLISMSVHWACHSRCECLRCVKMSLPIWRHNFGRNCPDLCERMGQLTASTTFFIQPLDRWRRRCADCHRFE